MGGVGDLVPSLNVVTRFLMLGFDFGFGLHSGIDGVVATMASWNKVSPASAYLVNVSGVGEGVVRVGAVRFVDFL